MALFHFARRGVVAGLGGVVLAPLVYPAARMTGIIDGPTGVGQNAANRKKSTDPAAPELFIEIAGAAIPRNVREFRTTGWSMPGVGAGLYVTDRIAQRLQIVHPRAVAVAADGRVFRLKPEENSIEVEQLGAFGEINPTESVDDRGAIQSAINYARATDTPQVSFTQPSYNIRVTNRSSSNYKEFTDGYGLTISASQRVRLASTAPQKTLLRFLSQYGQSMDGEQEGYNLQKVGGVHWRGSGIFIAKPGSKTASGAVLELENLIIDGGSRRNVATDSIEKSRWDVTHKGIWAQPGRPGASISIIGCEFVGWRGESVYCSNDTTALLYVRNSKFHHSNGQGLNPNSCKVDIDGCQIENCFIGIEGWTGDSGGRIVRTEITDCYGPNGSGGAVALQGGMHGTTARSGHFAPSEVVPGVPPVGEIDLVCRNSGRASIGWWLSGAIKLIDTKLALGAVKAFDEGSQYLDLDVTLSNQQSTTAQVVIAGGAGFSGDMLTNNCKLRINVDHIELAGAIPLQPTVIWRGSLGPHISVSIAGGSIHRDPMPSGTVLDYAPIFS